MFDFSTLPLQQEWAFADKTIKDTAYITHGYYTYPAKFIPQLASKLIKKYSNKNDIVIDPFMGSGTTIVEAIINHRIAIGTDVNEIAVLVAKVKTTLINYGKLIEVYYKLNDLKYSDPTKQLPSAKQVIKLNPKIDFWFKPYIKDKLIVLLHNILQIEEKDIKDFFLVAFAQILKSCSIWNQKSVKTYKRFK